MVTIIANILRAVFMLFSIVAMIASFVLCIGLKDRPQDAAAAVASAVAAVAWALLALASVHAIGQGPGPRGGGR